MCYLKKESSYDVIIGWYLMKELRMDVLYSEDVVVWDSIRLPVQKIQNGKWTDLKLLGQEYPKSIK